jgi:hypothetical protein
MLGNYLVATQLMGCRAVLSSIESVSRQVINTVSQDKIVVITFCSDVGLLKTRNKPTSFVFLCHIIIWLALLTLHANIIHSHAQCVSEPMESFLPISTISPHITIF